MYVDEKYGYITCSCGEKIQALKEYNYLDDQNRIINYVDVDNEQLEILMKEHLKNCPVNK